MSGFDDYDEPVVKTIEELEVGDRVRLTGKLDDEWTDLKPGDEGTVDFINDVARGFMQVGVKWDQGSSLMLLQGDPFEVVTCT